MTHSDSLKLEVEELRNRVSELECQSSEKSLSNTLRAIVEGTSVVSDDLFFETLLQYLSKLQDAQYAFVGEFAECRKRIRTRAVWTEEGVGENFEYDLVGTPCEEVVRGEIKLYSDNVQQRFPKDELLKTLGVRSYLAVPLVDSDAEVLGHLAVMDVKAKPESDVNLSIFQIFAARATVELKRRSISSTLSIAASQNKKIELEAKVLRDELRQALNTELFVGESKSLSGVLEQVGRVAPTDSTVLILGESGTGKELIAREIHGRSERKTRPLVRVNCAALPEPLIESELFGHRKGAFTGATEDRIGRFESANGGTIFLDEIGELPLNSQSRLLRVLQEGEFERVGSNKTYKVDVRVVAATNRDLYSMVNEGRFREDLFFRLNVFPLYLPPLRKRREDIPALAEYLLNHLRPKVGGPIRELSPKFVDDLCRYDWPGNIRELQNVIERAMILSTGGAVSLAVEGLTLSFNNPSSTNFPSLAENEKRHILTAIEKCQGVIGGPNGASDLLKINANTLRSKMEKLGIGP